MLPVGIWGVGISREDINLDQVPLGEDEHSWVLRSDSRVYHNGKVLFSLEERVEEGDIIVSRMTFTLYPTLYCITCNQFFYISQGTQVEI